MTDIETTRYVKTDGTVPSVYMAGRAYKVLKELGNGICEIEFDNGFRDYIDTSGRRSVVRQMHGWWYFCDKNGKRLD